jgi:CRISPR-associated protein Cas2
VIVLVLTACPEGLRGHLTRWLLEVSAGVFVGQTTHRVREELWERTTELVGKGRALMVFTSTSEQCFEVRSHGHHWAPEDVEGVTLMRRPVDRASGDRAPGTGWSTASRRRHVAGPQN